MTVMFVHEDSFPAGLVESALIHNFSMYQVAGM